MNTGKWLRVCGLYALAGSISIGFASEMQGKDLTEGFAGAQDRCRGAIRHCGTREIVREITDAAAGSRWLLFRDPGHTGGPGKLVLMTAPGNAQRDQGRRFGAVQRTAHDLVKARTIVIRSGDHLVVRDQTPSMALALEGTALGAAAEGESLSVRLRIGGTVRAIAVLPGMANLAAQREAQQ